MSYSSKKIRSGLYEYRAYTIEYMHPHTGDKLWFITPPEEVNPSDAVNTLTDAKGLVDFYYETEE